MTVKPSFKYVLAVTLLIVALPAWITLSALYRSARGALLPEQQRWLEDLAYVQRVLEQEHADLEHYVDLKRFRKRFGDVRRELRESVDTTIDDARMTTKVLEIVASIGDPHTGVNNLMERMGVYPFYVYPFEEGPYVIAAREPHAALLGGRLLTIDEMPVEAAVQRLRAVVPHSNESGFLAAMPGYLRLPALLHALGIAREPGKIELAVRTPDGVEVTVALGAIDHAAFRALDDYRILNGDASEEERPLYRRNRHRNYWFSYLEDDKLLYVRFRLAADDSEEDGEAFWERMFAYADGVPIERFVVDLRGNSGGDNFFHLPLIAGIRARPYINARDVLFTVIDRGTFSAAITCAGAMERFTETRFVGEPFGDRPVTGGDPRYYTLPHHGLQLAISRLLWVNTRNDDPRLSIPPGIPVAKRFEDYVSGRDPALERILQYTATPSEAVASTDPEQGDPFSPFTFLASSGFEQELARLGALRSKSPGLLALQRNNLNMLSWQIAHLAGDRPRALEVTRLNAALNPDDPFVYIRWAQMSEMNGSRLRASW